MGRPLQEGILLLGSGQQRWNKEIIRDLHQNSSTLGGVGRGGENISGAGREVLAQKVTG